VETGNLDRDRGSSSTDVLPVVKGVIWLFLATFAEVTPVVSPAGFARVLFSHYITLQVFITLDLNGKPPNLLMMSLY
jgi:hypothetical protein